MAKKNRDFKPDPSGAGLLSRMYVTPNQRRKLLRWGLFSLVTVAALVLQDVVFSRMHIFGATTDLVPAVLLMVCVLRGAESGGLFVLLGSVVYVLSGSAPMEASVLLLTGLGLAAAGFREGFLRRSFGTTMLCAGAAVLLYELLVFLLGVFLGLTIFSRVGVFFLTGLLSTLALPVLYPLLTAIDGIGGETWKE